MSEKIVDLKLVKTQKSDPVVIVDPQRARECDGVLIWEKAATHVFVGDNDDSNRFNREIGKRYLDLSSNWLEATDPKIAKKLRKLLRRL